MEVKIAFDTDKESVQDLKRLLNFVQELIVKRESGAPAMTATQVQMTTNKVQQPTPTVLPTNKTQSAGGGKIIPYQDMSGTMSKIFSGGL